MDFTENLLISLFCFVFILRIIMLYSGHQRKNNRITERNLSENLPFYFMTKYDRIWRDKNGKSRIGALKAEGRGT